MTGKGIGLVTATAVLAAISLAILVPGSRSAPTKSAAPVALVGTIVRTANGIGVAIRNTGPDTYNAIRITMVATVHHTGAEMQGGQCGPGISTSDVLCVLITPFAPGQSVTVFISTDGPYPDNGGGQVWWSSNGPPGPFAGPGVLAGPSPPARLCACKKIDTRVTRTALNFTDELRWHFQLVWTMKCTGGPGRCAGLIRIVPPAGLKITLPKNVVISCKGTCAKKASKRLFVGGTSSAPRGLYRKNRKGKTFEFRFLKFCLVGGATVPKGAGEMTVVYDNRGFTDQKRSDFNGNGIPDGRER
jgi:hypothetical protein